MGTKTGRVGRGPIAILDCPDAGNVVGHCHVDVDAVLRDQPSSPSVNENSLELAQVLPVDENVKRFPGLV